MVNKMKIKKMGPEDQLSFVKTIVKLFERARTQEIWIF